MIEEDLLAPQSAANSTPTDGQIVTMDNFTRAESDNYFAEFVKEGGFGKLKHNRTLADVKNQTGVRLNRDTLYSFGVFDLDAGPVIVDLPDTKGRFVSLQLISEDHYNPATFYDAGAHKITREQVGSRYVTLAVRTFVDPSDEADLQKAHAIQDSIKVEQPGGPGTFDIPTWDQASLAAVRNELKSVGSSLVDMSKAFGVRGEVDPRLHLVATAVGWGGNPARDALYVPVVPEVNDGKQVYRLTVKDVPIDGFWSITVYNQAGFLVPDPRDAYSLNNITATKDSDGGYTVQFGGCEAGVSNCLPTMPGWNYLVRLYRPRAEILDGRWKFPDAQPVGYPKQAAQPVSSPPTVLTDGSGARSVRIDNLHKVRFAEIFLAHLDPKSGKMVAECYNTSLFPDAASTSKDTAPQAWATSLDFNLIKNEFGVPGASLNGPKLWMPDWIEVQNGVVREFNGRKLPWVARLDMGDNTGGVSESAPYKPVTIARDSGIGWNKGTTVLLLDDAEDNTWIMKGFEVGLAPKYTFEQFVAAGQSQFKKLPPGWKFRVKELEKDLIERPQGGVATIMPDEFFNVFDKTGPGMSNYKP